jgi:hypothetical protein
MPWCWIPVRAESEGIPGLLIGVSVTTGSSWRAFTLPLAHHAGDREDSGWPKETKESEKKGRPFFRFFSFFAAIPGPGAP